jgi:L-alanine-DL-glutamate epimerase-like enolase superfamily enzyme
MYVLKVFLFMVTLLPVADAKWDLSIKKRELPLAERFTISRESWDSSVNVFVALSYGGLTGVGEASPHDRWDESPESVIAQLEAVDLGSLAGPFDLEGVSELLPAGAARAALDIALHDLAARRAGIGLSDLLGLAGRSRPPTSVTVPISDPDRMLERARSLADHPALKLKVGFDGDVDVVRAIRSVYDGVIRIDANEGWDPADAIERLESLAPLGIELCEQPIPAGSHNDLARVTEMSPIPVVADEDACTAADVADLVGVVDGVNLKLRKTGGVREFIRAAAVARANGLKVMIGCDLESGVAITAGAHVAALVDWADLDGPLLLAQDPFPGVAYDRGAMTLPDGPGLGMEVSL